VKLYALIYHFHLYSFTKAKQSDGASIEKIALGLDKKSKFASID